MQSGDGPEWLTGGSYVVSRRIATTIETWDRTSLVEQEQIIGRTKREGAPLGPGKEVDPVDLTATSISENSHIRLANPNSNEGSALLRRGYSFVDGTTELGRLDAGLFFLAYQRDPRTGFIRVQPAHPVSTARTVAAVGGIGAGVFAAAGVRLVMRLLAATSPARGGLPRPARSSVSSPSRAPLLSLSSVGYPPGCCP